jgi:ankyrin repeat protein
MDSSTEVSAGELLKAFERATTEFSLCPNRVWAVAKENLPKLLPANKSIPGHEKHDQCTFDFCEFSQRDFTAVVQRHECKEKNCARLEVLFSRDTLEEAAKKGKPTVWSLNGKALIEPPFPYMAISHVWSDGTGTGAWQEGEVNKCLYNFFERIADQFQCDGIWWDTLCIPRAKAARTQAIRKIQSNYQDARITLVHDCFLRNWEWVDAEAACFAILMSPWFTRGWTALELAKSRKVKVVFKGLYGPLIKDLDEEILTNDSQEPSGPHKGASDIIKSLRAGITTLNDLLIALGPRYTSQPKDKAIISGLLVGVEVAPKPPQQDIWQQDIYRDILRKIGNVSPGHLFHNSATMSDVSWCPTSLFNMPTDDSEVSLRVTEDLDLIGRWRLIPVRGIPKEKLIWNGTHPLVKARLALHLQQPDKCVLLAECGLEFVDRALLVRAVVTERATVMLCYQYVGAVYFHPSLTEEDIGKATENLIEMEVVLLGNVNGTLGPDKGAWELVVGLEPSKSDGTEEKKSRAYSSNTLTMRHNQAHDEIEISSLTWPVSTGDDKAAMEFLQTVNPNVREPISQRTSLHYAIWRGYHGIFLDIIEKYITDVPDRLGQQPLHLAAERGDKEKVSRLLAKAQELGKKEGMLSARSDNGQTALHRAAWGGSAIVVKRLLEEGSNANVEDNDGNTALHIAVEMGFEVVVALLFDKENINAKGRNGLTPLHCAVMSGNNKLVERLVSWGADVGAKDHNMGWTPLHIAAENGQSPVVELLLKNDTDVNARDTKISWTPLHFAAMKGHEAVVKLLVKNGADVSAKDTEGWTPLRFAANRKLEAVVRLLIYYGADVEATSDKIRWTPLHLEAVDGQRGIIKLLVENGLDIDTMSDTGSPLHLAAQNGQEIVAKLLLDKGAKIDAQEEDGTTPLHWAARSGKEGVVRLLVSEGAYIDMNDRWGRSPLMLAVENGHGEVVKVLIENDADVNKEGNARSPLHLAAEYGHTVIVKLLVNKGANIDIRIHDSTPLHTAIVSGGHEGIVRMLIGYGAAIDSRSFYRQTPLHYAVHGGYEGIVKLLLDSGADINTEDFWNKTPMYSAIEKGHEGILRLLLDNHGNVDLEDMDKMLQLAAENGYEEIVRKLINEGVES